jgi:hypothetical protein
MLAFATSNAVQHLFSVRKVISPLKEGSVRNLFLLALSSNHLTLLLDAGSLTGEVTEIVKFSATNLTTLVHLDAVDVGRLDREDTLYTYGTRHFTNGETLLVAMAADSDDHATIQLNTLLVTLDNFVSDSDGVT